MAVRNALYIAAVVVLVHASALLSGGRGQFLLLQSTATLGSDLQLCDSHHCLPSPATTRLHHNATTPPPPAPGLTLGLLSLDPLELQAQRRGGSKAERRRAARLLPIVARTHQVGPVLITPTAAAAGVCSPDLHRS